MSRDIDKEKKDQRKAESLALREVRKQQVLQTVLRASNLAAAAKTLDTNGSELRARLENYGVKHEFGERWNVAVKDYLDAGQPHQYELPVSTLEEFVVKPRYLNFEEKNLQMEFKTLQMEFKLEQAIKDRNSDDKEVDWFDDETFEKPWSWIDETELEEQLELDIQKVDYTMNPVVELARKEGERVKYWENKGYQTNALHTPYRASKAFNPATYNPSEK